jgi:hypothetical protein
MQVGTALTSIARRAAVSVVAGLLVSACAAAALVLGTVGSTDRLAVGRTIWGSLAPVFSAVLGAGFLAGVVVFASLIANDAMRSVGPWLVARRGWFLGPFRAIGWLVAAIALAVVVAVQFVVRSTVVADLVWLVRTVGRLVVAVLFVVRSTVVADLVWLVHNVGRPVVLVLGCGLIVGLCAILYGGVIVLGFACIVESTRLVVAMLEDPPRPFAMAIGMGGAAAVMYIGVAAFTLCGWLAYRATRAGLPRASAASSRPANAWTGGRNLAP